MGRISAAPDLKLRQAKPSINTHNCTEPRLSQTAAMNHARVISGMDNMFHATAISANMSGDVHSDFMATSYWTCSAPDRRTEPRRHALSNGWQHSSYNT
eukprot:scaffold1231_cov107-Cylindrotheca_fusiformis.AAC.19